jgi:hypothetical protein
VKEAIVGFSSNLLAMRMKFYCWIFKQFVGNEDEVLFLDFFQANFLVMRTGFLFSILLYKDVENFSKN